VEWQYKKKHHQRRCHENKVGDEDEDGATGDRGSRARRRYLVVVGVRGDDKVVVVPVHALARGVGGLVAVRLVVPAEEGHA
jgi:hypothetical protein